MQQSSGFTLCHLKKSLYGLKQAPRACYGRFSYILLSLGFQASLCDTSLFTFRKWNYHAYLLLYVDDIVLTAFDPTLLARIIHNLSTKFVMSNMGRIHHLLGVTVPRDNSTLFLSQAQHVRDILIEPI